MGEGCCTLDNGLVLSRQGGKGFVVNQEVQLWTAFPPTGVVVVGSHFIEAQLLVIVGTNPFSRINRAFFQGLVNLTTGDVLWHATHALQDTASKTTNTDFHTLDVGNRFDFFAVPAAHLGTGIAAGEVNHVELGVELTHQLQAIAFVHPSGHLAAV